jgi:hypothetical protein
VKNDYGTGGLGPEWAGRYIEKKLISGGHFKLSSSSSCKLLNISVTLSLS